MVDPDVDTVYVAVPNFLHYEIAKEALEHGKNVICEKPFVESTAQAKELKQLADEKDLIILEAITNLYVENFKAIQKEIKNIAPIHIVNMNYTQYSSRYDAFLEGKIAPVFDPNKDGGALMDLNIYNIHLVAALFGMPDKVQYYANMQKGVDTSGILHLSYPDKQASLTASKDSYVTPRSFIEGEKGSICIDGSTGELNNFTVQMRGKEPKRYNLNKYDHRMTSEFNAFSEIIDNHDTVKADEAFVNTLESMQILTAARNSEE
jgi:predicted dehydrogenase